MHVTPEDLERYGDEEQARAAWEEETALRIGRNSGQLTATRNERFA